MNMTNWSNGINKLIKIMLDLADISDEKQETPFDREMGLGYRAFTGYIRKGCKDIIDLQSKYYSAHEREEYAKMELKINEELLEKIFGRTDVDVYNNEEIARFKALADEIQKEIDAEVEE
jgi:hypothetical protein